MASKITFLFTDIEGSTQLWEQEPERMQTALARHDALVRASIASSGGTVVKMTGDGVYAAFDEPSPHSALPWRSSAESLRPGKRTCLSCESAADFTSVTSSGATTITSAAPSIARRASWPRRTAARSCCRKRSSIACASSCRPRFAARSRPRAPQGPGRSGARVSACPPGVAAGFPRAAIARDDAQQPAAADLVVRRARTRGGGGAGTHFPQPVADARRRGRNRQDSPRTAGRVGDARRVPRPVPPLSLPAAGSSLESLARSEAAQMFIERVRLQDPAFRLTERPAAAITSICNHLDGIPLALELAAARAHRCRSTRSMSGSRTGSSS